MVVKAPPVLGVEGRAVGEGPATLCRLHILGDGSLEFSSDVHHKSPPGSVRGGGWNGGGS